MGRLGAETGGFHILNHALFKATLFLVAGIVAHEAGTRKIDDLGGLAEDLPVTAVLTGIAALGMAGFPPFNGFYSKEKLFEATYELAHVEGGLWWIVPAVAVVGSIFTVVYSLRFLALFLGEKPDALEHVHSPGPAMLAPPTVLASLAGLVGLGGVLATVGIHTPIEGFVERVVTSSLPAVEAAAHGAGEQSAAGGAGAGDGGGHGEFTYYLPTYLSVPVGMSIATMALGLGAYAARTPIQRAIEAVLAVDPLRADWHYDRTLVALDHTRAVDALHDGSFRTYVRWLFAGACVLTLAGYFVTGAPWTVGAVEPGLPIATVFVVGVAIVGAIAAVRAPSHVAGVLGLSILGFAVAIFFILVDAPDLALTQLVVETLVLVIFLLVLDKLPAFYGTVDRLRQVSDGLIAALVGVTVTATVLVTTSDGPDGALARFFVEHAGVPDPHPPVFLNYGGGHNVVNVILVDFRAFDTLGEISVVAMAALSIVTLIVMRGRGEAP